MAKLNKEAVGQYNYVVADDTVRRTINKTSDVKTDASVELVVKHPKHLQLVKLEPPKLYETAYHSDFRPPPKENLIGRQQDDTKKYSAYEQRSKLKSAPTVERATVQNLRQQKQEVINDYVSRKNQVLKSLLEKNKPALPPRAKTAEPAVARKSGKTKEEERKTADFQRAIIQGRSEWKHRETKSHDVLNPEKPSQLRETNPYGAVLENMQETVAQKYMDDDGSSLRTGSSMSLLSDRLFIDSRPQTYQSGRVSRRSGTAASDRGSKAVETPLHAVNVNILEPIQEEGVDEENISNVVSRTKGRTSRYSTYSAPDQFALDLTRRTKAKPGRQLGKVKAKQINLFDRKVPDKRFYKPHKMRQTPNEMNQFKKMRNRTFFKPLEQAIHEKDYVDHEAKYEPERQLLLDARWRIRQDLKDVRTKNINSLVDRYAQRAELKREEKRGRLGLPTYAGRDPVSIYKLRDTIPEGNQPRTDIQVNLPVRRRITPSIGSVQRARNLSTYANVWNQPSAPPDWGPQKIDHGLFLPPMAVNT